MSWIVILIMAGTMMGGFQSSKRVDFSGTWILDLKKSTQLPESFKYVESYSMEVKQTKDSLITTARLKGNGQDVKFPLTAYALNGSEVFREDTLRKSKRWFTASWTTTGKKFIVDSRVEQKGAKQNEQYTQHDVWELINNKTLQISVTQKFPKGKETHSERRVFHRVN